MSTYAKIRRNMFRALVLATLTIGTPSFAQKTAAPAPAAAGATANATPEMGPVIAAVVNGKPISIEELAEQCRIRFGKNVIDDLINKTAILQACEAQNIKITDKDVNDEISRIAMSFDLTSKNYLKLLKDERNVSEEQYAADIIWPMLALRSLAKDIVSVSPQEIDKEFQGQYGPRVKVRMIACKDQAKMADIHKRVVANPDSFKTIAKNESEEPSSASVEGLLPPIRRYAGDDALEDIAFNLTPNEVSQIFEAAGMYVILQCVQHIPAAKPPAAQMQEIQARIKRDLEDKKTRESAEQVFSTIRDKSQMTTIFGNPELEKQHPGVAAIVNGQTIPMQTLDRICVKRYGIQILGGEINRKLIENAIADANIQITDADIAHEISNAAAYFGVLKSDGTPDVDAWMKSVEEDEGMTKELYIRDVTWPTVALKKLTESQVTVTEEDLLKGFESNYGPRAEVLAIVLSNQRTAQQVWEMARNNPTEQFFGELAAQYSVEDSSRSNFGKVPPLRRHSGQPTLEKSAFELKPGEMSGIVEVNGNYVILRSQGFTTPVVSTMDESIRKELHRDILEKKHRFAMDQYLTKLRQDSEITNFLEPKQSNLGAKEKQEAFKTLEQATAK